MRLDKDLPTIHFIVLELVLLEWAEWCSMHSSRSECSRVSELLPYKAMEEVLRYERNAQSHLVPKAHGVESRLPELPSWALHLGQTFLLATALIVFSVVHLWSKRKQTRRKLEACGLPTVTWRPKFVNYIPKDLDSNIYDGKLPSYTITNILPRMERLKGPYGMYGTVYGISTAVVHIAHPVPASIVLSSALKAANSSPVSSRERRRSSIVSSSGATKEPAYDHFKNFCGEGVFTADGDDWKQKRAAVIHSLLRVEDGYESRMETESHLAGLNLVASLVKGAAKSSSSPRPGISVNVVPLLQRTTISLIYRYMTHETLDTSVETLWRESSDSPIDHLETYQLSITRIRMIILAQSRSMWFLLPRWIYRTFSSLFREEEATMGPIRTFAKIACQRALPGSPLASLSEAPLYKCCPLNNPSKNLINEAITLLFAGQDTSAATLSWTLHLLSLYPDVQSKLAIDVRSSIPVAGSTDVLTKKTLSAMPYLDAVIKEAMRLYPVAPFVVRRLPSDLTIPNSTSAATSQTKLPADSVACIWIYGLHRNPDYWTCANDFVPERWLQNENRDIGISNGAFIPFAIGPRNCLGQPLAHIILRSLLARLILNFEFRDPRLREGVDPKMLLKDMQAGFTVLPQGGVHLVVTSRRHSSAKMGEKPTNSG